MSTTETALTAHLVMGGTRRPDLRSRVLPPLYASPFARRRGSETGKRADIPPATGHNDARKGS